jgi:hypothetical protein
MYSSLFSGWFFSDSATLTLAHADVVSIDIHLFSVEGKDVSKMLFFGPNVFIYLEERDEMSIFLGGARRGHSIYIIDIVWGVIRGSYVEGSLAPLDIKHLACSAFPS